MEEKWCRFDLWDGCLSWELPAGCTDARSLRDLPQNQEVFLGVGKDSFLVDMLELLADEPTEESAVRAHWKELSDANEVHNEKEELAFRIEANDPSNKGRKKSVPALVGMQEDVRVWVALFRLQKERTDLLVSWNQVDEIGPVERDRRKFERIVASITFANIDFLESK
jgi:hypothetical protein